MSRYTVSGLHVDVAAASICTGLGFTVNPGDMWGILGRNGVGKTTLLHTLAGLRPPSHGGISLDGVDLYRMRRRQAARLIGLVPQRDETTFPETVREAVLYGRYPHVTAWETFGPDDYGRADAALDAVGLTGFEQRLVVTLSGGERRRVSVATVLAQDPWLYLLDEPTNDLDLHYQIQILAYINRHVGVKGGAVIMIMHDPNLAARFCNRLLLLLGNGETLCGTPAELLQEATLSRLYGHPIRRVHDAAGSVFVPA